MLSQTLTRHYHNLQILSKFSLPHSFQSFTTNLSSQPHSFPNSPQQNILSEHFILEQLSNILPINPNTPKTHSFATKSLLSPEDKLRGIFLQKITGKSSLESSLSSTNVILTPQIFSDVLNKGNMSGAAMVSFFNWVLRHSDLPKSTQLYNVVLKSLGKKKFLELMVEVCFGMRENGVKPDLETLEIVLDCFVRARRVSKAVEFFKRIDDVGADCEDSDVLNMFLRCLCNRSHVGVASSLLNSMRGEIRFSEVTYNEIIGGWAKFGMVDRVEKYWREMVEDDFVPDCQTFCYLIEALGRSKRIGKSVEIFDEMEEKGCIPDTFVYNAMISNFVSVGDVEEAINYYKRMFDRKCCPDVVTYNKLIKGLLKVRRVADALELFDEMLRQGVIPSGGMITCFIERLCNFGPPYAAMMMYKKCMKVGCRVSLKAYKLLFMRLSRCGKGGMLLKLWEEMQDSGYALDNEVYDHIVNGLCNIGQVETAVLVINEALRRGCCPGRIVYSKLNSKLLALSKVEVAYKLFLKVKDARNNENLQNYWRSKGWHF